MAQARPESHAEPEIKPEKWNPAMVWSGDPLLVFASEHLAIVATGLGFLLVAIEVLIAARLDPTVAVAIVSTASPTVVLPGILIVAMPAVCVLAFYGSWYWVVSVTMRKKPVAFSIEAAFIATLAFLFFVPLWGVVFYLLFLPLPVFVKIGRLLYERRQRKQAGAQPAKPETKPAYYSEAFERFVTVAFATLFPLLMLGPMWMPAEDVRLTSGPQVTGYVLDSDSEWTSVLRESDRTIVRLHTADIKSREVCVVGAQRQGALLQLLAPPATLPTCP